MPFYANNKYNFIPFTLVILNIYVKLLYQKYKMNLHPNSSMNSSQFIAPLNDVKEDLLEIGAREIGYIG